MRTCTVLASIKSIYKSYIYVYRNQGALARENTVHIHVHVLYIYVVTYIIYKQTHIYGTSTAVYLFPDYSSSKSRVRAGVPVCRRVR